MSIGIFGFNFMGNINKLSDLALELENIGYSMLELAYQPYYVIPDMYKKYDALLQEAIELAKNECCIPKKLVSATYGISEYILGESNHSKKPEPMIDIANEIKYSFYKLYNV